MINFTQIKNIIEKHKLAFVFVDISATNSGFFEFGNENRLYFIKIGNFNAETWSNIINLSKTMPWKPVGGAKYVCSEEMMSEIIPKFMENARIITNQLNYSKFTITEDDRF